MSAKIEFLELGVRKAPAGWVAFHKFKVNSVPRIEEAEAAASEAVADMRLMELIYLAYKDAGDEARNAAYGQAVVFVVNRHIRRAGGD